MLQNFRRAVEEGREVLDRRAGRQPATQHGAWDALDASDERNQVCGMSVLDLVPDQPINHQTTV